MIIDELKTIINKYAEAENHCITFEIEDIALCMPLFKIPGFKLIKRELISSTPRYYEYDFYLYSYYNLKLVKITGEDFRTLLASNF